MTNERILVVDDEPSMLRSVERVLTPHYRVATARTAGEAIALADELAPDLAILDIRMPEMDGFVLMGRLRELRRDLDIIFMTGIIHELDAQLIRSIRERAFYFIQKPFDREVLLTIVERCLELRRLGAENRRHVERLEAELAEARAFQRGLLPAERARLGRVSIAARYEPCTELGGDFFDFAETGNGRTTVLISDVSGHGVSAAMLTAIVKSAFHDAHADDYEPLSIVGRVASGIRSFDPDRFVTLFCARIAADQRTIEYVNAGHPPALLWGEERGRMPIGLSGPMISPAFPDVAWEQGLVELLPSDRLLLYTDGITEASGDEGLFGEERLFALAEMTNVADEALLDEILSGVSRFCGGRPQTDDRTLLAVRSD